MQGPALRAVMDMNPSAIKEAEALDLERKLAGLRGPLHGIPILVKDNIATVASEGQTSLLSLLSLSLLMLRLSPSRNEHHRRLLRTARLDRPTRRTRRRKVARRRCYHPREGQPLRVGTLSRERSRWLLWP